MVMGEERRDDRQPRERLKECDDLYTAIITWLELPELDEPQRPKFIEHVLREAIERDVQDNRDARSAGELLGFTHYSEDQIDEILAKEPDSEDLPIKNRDRRTAWKPVRLLLAGTHQDPPVKIRRAREKQERWADAAAAALYHYLQHIRTTPSEVEKLRAEFAHPTNRQRRVAWIAIFGTLVLTVTIVAIINPFKAGTKTEDAKTLEQRYDGKDPRGKNDTDSKCADPPNSEPVTSSQPPVMGPEGKAVGEVHLRTSPICPVIWGRVVWGGNTEATYTIPKDWTLHVVIHRPDTKTSFDFPEPENAPLGYDSPIPYALSPMMTTMSGCAYVEAYFTNGDRRTVSATTSCIKL